MSRGGLKGLVVSLGGLLEGVLDFSLEFLSKATYRFFDWQKSQHKPTKQVIPEKAMMAAITAMGKL